MKKKKLYSEAERTHTGVGIKERKEEKTALYSKSQFKFVSTMAKEEEGTESIHSNEFELSFCHHKKRTREY